MKIVHYPLLLLAMLMSAASSAQDQKILEFTNAQAFTLIGKADTMPLNYHRVDTNVFSELPKAVKSLLKLPAGLAVTFITNSPIISAKWTISDQKASSNMTPIMAKGLDLYIKKDGEWQFAGVGRPTGSSNQATLVENMDASEKECLLYLPLWDELFALEIGVEQGTSLTTNASPFSKQILVYGSSIVHGASASRPGLAYPAQLSRKTGLNFVNLGVSGNAKMEAAVADMLASFKADALVLDCVPNSSPEEIMERTNYLVKTFREQHPQVPILIIPSIVREHGFWNQKVGDRVEAQNKQIALEYQKLIEEGVEDLYFINPPFLLGQDHEGTVDGTHPNDLGFSRMLEKLTPEIMNVLSTYEAF